jgi:small-conductance mechanosensitive channel
LKNNRQSAFPFGQLMLLGANQDQNTMSFKTFFHYVSYLQYPLLLVAIYFMVNPYFHGIEHLKENPDLIFQNFNSVLIFMGLGISFSSLQDTTKTQSKFSKKVWQNPRSGKLMITMISIMILIFLTYGLIGYYYTKSEILEELSIGLIILSLGMLGFLKVTIEMFEYNRLDKNQQN